MSITVSVATLNTDYGFPSSGGVVVTKAELQTQMGLPATGGVAITKAEVGVTYGANGSISIAKGSLHTVYGGSSISVSKAALMIGYRTGHTVGTPRRNVTVNGGIVRSIPTLTQVTDETIPLSDTWRLYFRDGGIDSSLEIGEVEMYETLQGSVDICTGGVANSTSSDVTNVADNAFDGSTTTYWSASEPVGSWLEYSLPSEKKVFAFQVYSGPNNHPPRVLALQCMKDGIWQNVVTFLKPIPWSPQGEWLRFDSTNSIAGTLISCTSGVRNTAPTATKGNSYISLTDLVISKVELPFEVTSQDVAKVCIVELDSGYSITKILAEAADQAINASGFYEFEFTNPATIKPGTRIAVLVVRNDDTSTSIANVMTATSGAISSGRLSFDGFVTLESIAPQVGDTVAIDNGGTVVEMTLTERF